MMDTPVRVSPGGKKGERRDKACDIGRKKEMGCNEEWERTKEEKRREGDRETRGGNEGGKGEKKWRGREKEILQKANQT